jgi:hypothetical protein
MPKARKTRFTERRVVFLSSVPDEAGFSKRCGEHFRAKLKPIRFDDSNVPLETISTDELLKAGDAKAVADEKLHDVTDLVALLSSPYFAVDEKAKGSEFAFFVQRRLDQEVAGAEDTPLTFWLAPVEARLRLKRYTVGGLSLGDTRCQRWWHPFKREEERFSVEPDRAAALSDEIAVAVDRLLAHTQQQCPKCKKPASGGIHE